MMRGRWVYSAPANLLLAGEYAVTRPGGLGLAVAVEPRATVEVGAATAVESDAEIADFRAAALEYARTRRTTRESRLPSWLEVVAVGSPSISSSWPRDENRLFEAVVAALAEHLADSGRGTGALAAAETSRADGLRWQATVDTSDFFDPTTGNKLGFGSSAVACVLLTAALMRLAGIDPLEQVDLLVTLATRAHRLANGGRGSGYDVATSARGGAILFHGGEEPVAEPIDLADRWQESGYALHTVHLGRPVQTRAAVEQFDRVFADSDDAARTFLERNNELVREIVAAAEWPALFDSLARAREAGVALGAEIGVDARLPLCVSHRDDGWIAKASGAGNERAVVVSHSGRRRPLPRSARSVPIVTGLRLEPFGIGTARSRATARHDGGEATSSDSPYPFAALRGTSCGGAVAR